MTTPDPYLISLPQGHLRGATDNDTACWLGIPYAAAPVGALRWRAPQPAPCWEGVRDADHPGSASWQNAEQCSTVGGGEPGNFSEDCLYLNIWVPRRRERPLPVMVWLHGGGFTLGAGGLTAYNGASLAARGVIVVTLNYRLGHLGFFAHPALDTEEAAPVNNFALLDQIAALRWVQQHIAAFGGDAANVTLFGESAGARSVLSLMASPLAVGLFHKAMVQSAYALPDMPREKALEQGVNIARHFGLEEASAEQLRALPAEAFWPLPAPLNLHPTPVSGDSVLPEPMLDVFLEARQHPMPLLIGSNSDEASVLGLFGVDLARQIEKMRRERRFGLRLIRFLYSGVKGDEALGRQVCRDMVFTTMGNVVMRAQQRIGQPCWRYWFDFVSDIERHDYPHGAWHGSEVPYVFDNLRLTEPICRRISVADKAFARAVADYWVSFARDASAHVTALPGPLRWPACDGRHDRLLRLGIQRRSGFRLEHRFMRARMALFRRIMKHHVTLN